VTSEERAAPRDLGSGARPGAAAGQGYEDGGGGVGGDLGVVAIQVSGRGRGGGGGRWRAVAPECASGDRRTPTQRGRLAE
jgi:hypothetical protein